MMAKIKKASTIIAAPMTIRMGRIADIENVDSDVSP